jgi:hypothetical protein
VALVLKSEDDERARTPQAGLAMRTDGKVRQSVLRGAETGWAPAVRREVAWMRSAVVLSSCGCGECLRRRESFGRLSGKLVREGAP